PAAPPHLPSFPTRRSSDLSTCVRHRPPSGAATLSLTATRAARPRPAALCRNNASGLEIVMINEPRGRIDYEESGTGPTVVLVPRSEEHTSELQSLAYLVCR